MELEEKQYKGYNLFNHVRNPRQRAWNRCAMLFNTRRDGGSELFREYINQLDDVGRQHVKEMLSEIQQNGYENTRRAVIRELNG